MPDSPIKILLIEDNPGDARLIREMLADDGGQGFAIEWVSRLADGLERLSRGGIDLVLLDLGLPDSQGLDTFIKAQARAPQVPFVVLTGLADESLGLTALRKGAQDYLFKDGTDPHLLLRAIRYATERKQAEIALEVERKKLYSVLNSLPVFVHLKTEDHRIRFANRRFIETFGEPGDRPCYEVVKGVSEPCEECRAFEVLKTKVPQKLEWTTPRNARTYEIYNYPFCNEGDLLVLTLGIDITERKQAEAEKKLNENRLESLLKISQYHPESLQDLLDYALNEAIELTKSKVGYIYFYDEITRQFTLNTWSKEVMKECAVAEPQTVYQLEKTGIWGEAVRQARPIMVNDFQTPHPLRKGYPEGHVELYKYLTIPVFSDQRIVAVVGVANKATDYNEADVRQLTLMMDSLWKIVERQQADEALRQSESRYRLLFDTMMQGIVYQDAEGKIISMNPAAERILGEKPAEFLGQTPVTEEHHPVRVDGSPFPGLEHPSMMALRTGQEVRDVVMGVYNQREQGYRWININAMPLIREQDDKPHQVYTVFEDITGRKQAEEKLRESEQNLRSLASQLLTAQERERERISRGLHDELGQSLLVLKLQAGHIKKSLDKEQTAIRKECREMMRQLDRLVDEVRHLARDLTPTMVKDLGLSAALKRLIEEFTRLYDVQTDMHEMEDLNGLFPREMQIGIYRIFQESLTNIGKYAEASRITIAVKRGDSDVAFMVADNGRGCNLDEVMGRDPASRGLGLIAMKERAHMMGGTLEIQSQEGEGTRIAFRIPVSRSLTGADPEDPEMGFSEVLPALTASERKPPGP